MKEKVNFQTAEPKGLIKIELFENGKKVQKLEDHNFISKGAQEVFKARARDVFTQNRVKNGGAASGVFNDLFKQISLTDANHAEDANNEWLRKGELIGYATSTESYSGDDSLIGTYNVDESETEANRVRMVFDFPTHAANGEIKSIYFHASNAVYNISGANSKLLGNPIGLTDIRSTKKYNDKIYVLRNSRFEIYDNDWKQLDVYFLSKQSNIRDFEIVKDVIYFVSDNASLSVRKADLAWPEYLTTVHTGLSYTCGITYDYDTETFMVMDSFDKGTLLYFDKNFKLLDTKSMEKYGFVYQYAPIFYIGNGEILVNSFVMDKNLNFYNFFNLSDDPTPNPDLVCCGLDPSNTNFIYLSSKMLRVPKVSIGSRSLLATPITKKPTQTMKITYDFILE